MKVDPRKKCKHKVVLHVTFDTPVGMNEATRLVGEEMRGRYLIAECAPGPDAPGFEIMRVTRSIR